MDTFGRAAKRHRSRAEHLRRALESGISENRGVKAGFAREDGKNYFVNSRTNMPSCLAEIGFITDDGDNRLFDDNLDAYAQAIADGIAKTLNGI